MVLRVRRGGSKEEILGRVDRLFPIKIIVVQENLNAEVGESISLEMVRIWVIPNVNVYAEGSSNRAYIF